jgi:hypothetical protein
MNIQKFHPFILSTLFILPLFGCGGGGGGGSTPPPPPPTPRVAMIWSNGSPGCWGDPGDTCITGGVGGRTTPFWGSGVGTSNVAITDTITGGLPSLQVTSSLASGFAGFCIGNANGSCVSRDLSAFKNGHLRFDVRLESPTVTAVSITLFTGLTYQIPMSSLSLGQFVHLSIPLTPDLFGTNGPQQVLNVFQYNITNSAPSGNQVVLIMNDIKWTAD